MGKFAIATDLGRVGGRMENAVHYGTGETAIISVLWNKEVHMHLITFHEGKHEKHVNLTGKKYMYVGAYFKHGFN